MIEEQRRPPELSPQGCSIFGAAAALLVAQRSNKDIISPRALQQHQISGNAPVSIYEMGSNYFPSRPAPD